VQGARFRRGRAPSRTRVSASRVQTRRDIIIHPATPCRSPSKGRTRKIRDTRGTLSIMQRGALPGYFPLDFVVHPALTTH